MVSRCSISSGAGSSAQPSVARRPKPALVSSSRSSSVPPAHSGSLAAAAGWRAACTVPAAPPLSAPPWPRRRSRVHPARRRARRHARRRVRLARLRRRQRPWSAASRRTGHGVTARVARPPCGTRWRTRPCPRLAQSRRWRSAAPGTSALADPPVVARARAVAAARWGVAVRWGEAVRQRAAAWRLGWRHGAAPQPHGMRHSARFPPPMHALPPPPPPPPRAQLRWPRPGPAPPPRLLPPSEPPQPPLLPFVARWQLERAALAPRERTLRCCRHQWPSPWVQPSSSCPCPSWPPPPSPQPPPPTAPPPSRRPRPQRAPQRLSP
eukprot:scaffold43852_cov73-Phaeocystis_antarctica.AAC.8